MMTVAPLIAVATSLVLAGISLLRPPRRLRQITFAAGMVAFALESLLVYGLLFYSWTPTDHAWWSHANMARLFFTYLARRQMNVAELITHRYRPDQAQECYDRLTADRSSAIGVLFDWVSD